MKVSHNELTGLCRRAFEGLGFPSGEHEDAADMVVWLEQHGLHGVEARVVSSQRTGEGYRIGVRFYQSLHDLARASRAPYLRYLSGLEEQLPPA